MAVLAISSCLFLLSQKWREAGEKLHSYNYFRDAVKIFKEIGLIWSKIAQQASSDINLKHEILLKVHST